METFFQTTITPQNLRNQNSSSGLGRNMQRSGSEHHFFTTVQLAKRSWWQPDCWYCIVEKCTICQNSSHNCHLNGARSTAGPGKNFICQPWLIHSWKKNKTKLTPPTPCFFADLGQSSVVYCPLRTLHPSLFVDPGQSSVVYWLLQDSAPWLVCRSWSIISSLLTPTGFCTLVCLWILVNHH